MEMLAVSLILGFRQNRDNPAAFVATTPDFL